MRKKLLFLVLAAFTLTGSVPAQSSSAAQAAAAAQGSSVSPAETECYYCECNGGRCYCVEIPCG